MKQVYFSVILTMLLLSCQSLPDEVQHGDITFIPMETKRLPDMNEPRGGHALVWVGDHILAIGGHTTGFVTTATAEYYEGGRWRTIPTLYPHDTPLALVLNDGDALVGGGYEKNLGIGQTYGMERYHPETHSFSPAYAMDRKRAHASGLELENGEILISGNWYATDVTEIYSDTVEAKWIDTAADNRSYPFLLQVTNDNVWIIGGTYGSYGIGTQNVVDQTKGEPFSVDLLAEWLPRTPMDRNVQADAYRLAEYTFLIPAINAEGQWAPLLVDSTGFSLLPMEQPLPMEGPWGAIQYIGSFWTVHETQTAWLMGLDDQKHAFLAEMDCQPVFQGDKAKLTMHYSQPLEQLPVNPWEMMLPDGSFVTVGGCNHTQYQSSAAVYSFYPKASLTKRNSAFGFGICLALLAGLLGVVVAKKKKHPKDNEPTLNNVVSEGTDVPQGKSELAEKLVAVMEEKQLFRDKNMRLSDVATELHSNTTYLSACLNGELNTTFPAFVMGYRIRHAQELMRKNPTMRLSQVAKASGFTNEKTFLRNFKAACGVTPSEWKAGQA